ncbi:MAG: DUF2752 domain-containing protein [Ruminococcaceae bacterium]|nr:DUF2752 domain-containing protein [Oscillospiraceae bacterium]
MKQYTKSQKIFYIVLPFVLIPVLVILGRYISNYTHLFPPCPSYTLLHFSCPGCGTTRAVTALLHGDILLSLRQNPFVIIGIVLIALVYVEFLLKVFNKKLPFEIFSNMKITWTVLIALGIFTVMKNIFPILAPI